MRSIMFTPIAFEQLNEWAESDFTTYERIVRLINEVNRTPFHGIGKPEPLKNELKGYCGFARAVETNYTRAPISL